MALVNTNFSLHIVALDKIDHIFFKETLKKKKKLERIGTNQSQRGYNHAIMIGCATCYIVVKMTKNWNESVRIKAQWT